MASSFFNAFHYSGTFLPNKLHLIIGSSSTLHNPSAGPYSGDCRWLQLLLHMSSFSKSWPLLLPHNLIPSQLTKATSSTTHRSVTSSCEVWLLLVWPGWLLRRPSETRFPFRFFSSVEGRRDARVSSTSYFSMYNNCWLNFLLQEQVLKYFSLFFYIHTVVAVAAIATTTTTTITRIHELHNWSTDRKKLLPCSSSKTIQNGEFSVSPCGKLHNQLEKLRASERIVSNRRKSNYHPAVTSSPKRRNTIPNSMDHGTRHGAASPNFTFFLAGVGDEWR